MKIDRYYPAFISGSRPQSVQVYTQRQFLKIPWIKSWMEYPNFYRLSISKIPDANFSRIMAELNKGETWWVIATSYDNLDTLELPEWKYNKLNNKID